MQPEVRVTLVVRDGDDFDLFVRDAIRLRVEESLDVPARITRSH
jgi:hypothetical protein